jgi:hypothetical protein
MIRFVLSALLLSFAALALPAQAGTGGLSGYLLDPSGNPLANIEFWYGGPIRTDRHGFFAILMLEPGLYWAPRPNDIYSLSPCPEIPVFDGEVTRVRMRAQYYPIGSPGEPSGGLYCESISMLPEGLFDPNQGGDLYRI